MTSKKGKRDSPWQIVEFRVSYSSWKLQQKQPAVVSSTHVVLLGTCTLLYES